MFKRILSVLIVVVCLAVSAQAGRTTAGAFCTCGPDCFPEYPGEFISPICEVAEHTSTAPPLGGSEAVFALLGLFVIARRNRRK